MRYEILNDNNEVINTIIADLDFVQSVYPEKFREVADPLPDVIEIWNITKLAFKNRFPASKWIAARSASNSSPELYDFFESFDLATYINLKDQKTIHAVTSLSNSNVPVEYKLTNEEVSAVINVPAAGNEVYSI